MLIALELCLHVACGAHLVSGFPGFRHRRAAAVAPRAAALGALLSRVAHLVRTSAVGAGLPMLLSPCGHGRDAGPGVQLSGPPCCLGCFRGDHASAAGARLGVLWGGLAGSVGTAFPGDDPHALPWCGAARGARSRGRAACLTRGWDGAVWVVSCRRCHFELIRCRARRFPHASSHPPLCVACAFPLAFSGWGGGPRLQQLPCACGGPGRPCRLRLGFVGGPIVQAGSKSSEFFSPSGFFGRDRCAMRAYPASDGVMYCAHALLHPPARWRGWYWRPGDDCPFRTM